MAYAKRSTTRPTSSRLSTKLDPPQPDVYDLTLGATPSYFELEFASFQVGGVTATKITVWGNGLISVGPATQAQINFLDTYNGGSLAGFPGIFFSAAGSAQEYPTISVDPGQRAISWQNSSGATVGKLDIGFDQGQLIISIANAPGLEVSHKLDDGVYHSGTPNYAPDANGEIGGGSGDDVLFGNGTATTLRGLDGNDSLIGAANNENLIGGGGADYLDGQVGNDILTGGDGDDLLLTSAGSDIARGDAGVDTLVIIWNQGNGVVQNTSGPTTNAAGGFDGSFAISGGRSVSFTSIEKFEIFAGGGANSIVTASGDDIVVTGNGADTVDSGGGNDRVFSGGGNDLLQLGAGDDFVDPGEGSDVVHGGAGNDTLQLVWTGAGVMTVAFLVPNGAGGYDGRFETDTGLSVVFTSIEHFHLFTNDLDAFLATGNGQDIIVTGPGDDVVDGGASDDIIFTLEGNDSVVAEDGNDFIDTGLGNDVVTGNSGEDVLQIVWKSAGAMTVKTPITDNGQGGASGAYETSDGHSIEFASIEHLHIFAGEFADNIAAGVGADEIQTFGGDDNVGGGGGDDFLGGGDGDDQLFGDLGNDDLYGDAGGDRLQGGAGADLIFGGDGNDQLFGDDDNDELVGGAGTDRLEGGAGADKLFGNDGGDQLFGDDGNDDLVGDAGNDRLDGGAGDDRMFGELGNDLYYVDQAGDIAVELAGEGNDTILTSRATYSLAGTHIENLVATTADDNFFTGNEFDNYIDGGLGADSMTGGAGNDIYVLDNVGDTVTELAGGGTDEIRTTLGSRAAPSPTIYVLPAEVENLTGILGSAQLLQGNALDNVITTNAGADFVYAQDGGNDIVSTGAGNDFIYFGGAFTTADMANGGGGQDRLALYGDYFLTFGAGSLNGIERLMLYSAPGNDFDYEITTHDGNVAAGEQLEVVALSLGAGETLTFNGAAETNGTFWLRAGDGNDVLTGGAGADRISGGLGGDRMTGGAGGDRFDVGAVAHSTGVNFDTLVGFDATVDRINISGTVTGWSASVSGALSNSGFDAALAQLVDAPMENGEAVKVTVTGGDHLNKIFVVVDANGDGVYSAGADYVFAFEGAVTPDLEMFGFFT